MASSTMGPSTPRGTRHDPATPPTPASKTPKKQLPGETYKDARYLNGEWYCKCGLRMYLKAVRKRGPNYRRRFYSCENDPHENCGYFAFYDDVKSVEDRAAAKHGGIQTKLNFPPIASPQSARARQARIPSSTAPAHPTSSRNNDNEPDELAGPGPDPAPSRPDRHRIATPDLYDGTPQRQPPSTSHHVDRVEARSLPMKSLARRRRVSTVTESLQAAAPALPNNQRDSSPDVLEITKESVDPDDGLSVSSLDSADQAEVCAEADRLYEERISHGGKVPSAQPTSVRTPSPKRRRVEDSFGLPTPRDTSIRGKLRIAHEQREAKRAKTNAQADIASSATTKTTAPFSTPDRAQMLLGSPHRLRDFGDDAPPSPTTPSRSQPRGPKRPFGTSNRPALVPSPVEEYVVVDRPENSTGQAQIPEEPQRSPSFYRPLGNPAVSSGNRIEDKLEEAVFEVFNVDNMRPLPPEIADKLKEVLGSFTRNTHSLRVSRDMLRDALKQKKSEIGRLQEDLREQRKIVKKMREDRRTTGAEIQRLAERMGDVPDHD